MTEGMTLHGALAALEAEFKTILSQYASSSD